MAIAKHSQAICFVKNALEMSNMQGHALRKILTQFMGLVPSPWREMTLVLCCMFFSDIGPVFLHPVFAVNPCKQSLTINR